MKANELRIGNYFIRPNKTIGQITYGQITYHEIRLLVVALEKPNYKPIPLTEEWLLKFGFEKDKRYGDDVSVKEIKPSKYFILMFDNRDGSYFLCDTDVDTDIRYVHQLQNLYFALTNTELLEPLKQTP